MLNTQTHKTMKIQDLSKGEIYTDLLDKAIPLRFTGRTKEVKDYFCTKMVGCFIPVQTTENKNYYNPAEIWKSFNPNGNEYLTLAQ